MPRVESVAEDAGRAGRVREFLAEQTERDLGRLPTDFDAYDFDSGRDRLLGRLADLKAGRPVVFYGWQLRPALRPVGMVGARLYAVSRSAITLAVYQRGDGTVR